MGLPRNENSADAMRAMNMTPLIDVLLVLLVMFIITIPIATHSVEADLATEGVIDFMPDRVKNKVVVTENGQILWNGDAVDGETLRGLLARTKRMVPEPELQFEPEPFASYDLSARVVHMIDASEVNKFGFVGNDKYREFSKSD